MESPERVITRDIIANIVVAFGTEFNQHIIWITKTKSSEVPEVLLSTDRSILKKAMFIYAKNYDVILEKLLEMHDYQNTPKLIIIESLHQWHNCDFPMDRVGTIYSTLIATLQDLTNVCSRKLNESCVSVITGAPADIPEPIVDIFYSGITGNSVLNITKDSSCLNTIMDTHRNVI
ncbi:unnamed protein product [Diamesa hyperborea]